MYYSIEHHSDPKILGVKTGLSSLELTDESFNTKEEREAFFDFFFHTKFINRESKRPNFTLTSLNGYLFKSAKLLDFMLMSPYQICCEYVISQKAKDILDNFHLQEHYYFPITLWFKGDKIEEQYYVLYIPYLDYQIIDFSKSIIAKNETSVSEIVEVNTLEDYKKYLTPSIKKIAIKKLEFDDYDLFSPRVSGLLVSEKLKESLSEVTGIFFLERNVEIV